MVKRNYSLNTKLRMNVILNPLTPTVAIWVQL